MGSLLPSPPSNPCGSPKPTTTKPVHPSSTENASKFSHCTRSFSLQAALDSAFQPFNNLFSSSIFLILSLSFLYHIIIIFQRIEKFEQCTQRSSETLLRWGSLQETGRETTTFLFIINFK